MGGSTVWSIHPEASDQFAPSKAAFMVNNRVDDLYALIAALKAEGCNVLEKIDDSEYGKFGWVIDDNIFNVQNLWRRHCKRIFVSSRKRRRLVNGRRRKF
jgi:hypothetical protein